MTCAYGGALIAFHQAVTQEETAIKAFLKQHMYRHERVMRVMNEAGSVLSDLFARYQKIARRSARRMAGGHRQRVRGERARRDRQFHPG